MGISLFLPVRTGSTRAINKNTRPFAPNGDSLVHIKLSQLIKVKDFYEIIFSTNCPIALKIAEDFKTLDERIKIIRRPEELCQNNTKVGDIIKYVTTLTNSDHIMWTHVTSPFVNEHDFRSAIKTYMEVLDHSHDSIVSFNKLQNFIWDNDEKQVVNNKSKENRWPNTQDLKPLYEINHAFYLTSRNIYIERNDRVGSNPFLYECEGEKRIDIDWEFDFQFAQKVYRCVQ